MSTLSSGMWALYKKSFKKSIRKNLKEEKIEEITNKAHKDYNKIISKLPKFDKGDRFKVNIINCAMLTSFLLNFKNKYSVDEITIFYKDAMENKVTKYFCTHSNTYTKKGQEKLEKDAKESQNYKSPYAWKFTYEKGKTLNQYTVKFYTCGICRLMNEYGLKEYIPAMCKLDYDMAKWNNTEFERKYTIASGYEYCDCNYNHRGEK